MSDNNLITTILTVMATMILAMFGYILKSNGDIKTLKAEKTSKKEVSEMIDEKLKIQYDKIDQNISFVTKCVTAIAKELNIITPLE